MSTAKFKVGDILRVVCRSGFPDEGSKERENFIVKTVTNSTMNGGYLYFPTDEEQGAFENQLRYSEIKSWKQELTGETK